MEGGGRRETAHAGRKLAVTLGEEARKSGGETRSAGDEGAREEAGSLSAVAGGDERKRRESEREQRARLTLLFLLRHLAHAEMALATRCEPATSAGGWMTNASMKKRGSNGGGRGKPGQRRCPWDRRRALAPQDGERRRPGSPDDMDWRAGGLGSCTRRELMGERRELAGAAMCGGGLL